MTQQFTTSTMLNATKIKVKNFEINYYKFGNGPQKLLIFPGTLGHIGDFRSLTENLDREKFTIYVWDPPGYGLSRPPSRDFSSGYLYRDADLSIELMEKLAVDRYSLLGWCNGGCTAMIAASKAPDRVDKLVVWSCNAFITESDVEKYETTRDVYSWPDVRKVPQFEMYGGSYVSDTWCGFLDACRVVLDESDGDMCKDVLAHIKTPTLILHGEKDPIVPVEHGIYLHENIKHSTLEIIPDGKHILHMMFPEKFNSVVDSFLTTVTK